MKQKFASFSILLKQYLKRDYLKIIVWVIGIGLFSGGFVPFFVEIAKDNGLFGMYETMKNPAMIAMTGPTPVLDASDYTVGAMYSHMMLLFSGLFAIIVSILHVISHTRKEEENNLIELIRSFKVGKLSNSLAVISEIIIINLLLTLFIFIVMISFGAQTITAYGAFIFSISIGLAGITWGIIALLVSQIMQSSSGATTASLSVLGSFYILRGITDISNISLSKLNPLAWIYLSNPFIENNSIYLLIGIIFNIILLIISFKLENKRDLGFGYLKEREGKGQASKSLLSLRGLFIKLNKNMIISYLIAFFILGAAYGAIYNDMHTFIESNDLIKQMFTNVSVTVEESFTGVIMMIMALLVTILPITIINKYYHNEKKMYLNQILSTKVKRKDLYFTTIEIAIVFGVIGLFSSGLGIGLAALYVLKGRGVLTLSIFIKSILNYFPVVIFFISLSSLIISFKPKLNKIVYSYLGYCFIINYFEGILKIPKLIQKSTIVNYLPRMPIDSFSLTSFISICLISIIIIYIGYLKFNKRDLETN